MEPAAECLVLIRERLRDIRDRLVTVLERLSPEDLRWRPNEASNSAANLVVHICGNVRQRIHVGIAATADTRDRDAEFADREPHAGGVLIALARQHFGEADAILAALPPGRLFETQLVRGAAQTHLQVLIRAVGHLSEHLGQIIYIAKARHGERFETLSIPLPRQ